MHSGFISDSHRTIQHKRYRNLILRASFSDNASLAPKQPQIIDSHTISSQWSFLPREQHDTKMIQNILVCGDGDLSFSADIAAELDSLGIQLFATVLEDEKTHNKGMLLLAGIYISIELLAV